MIVLHHLASSGGTIFTKAMVAQDNCVFLNEMHPHFTVIPEHGFSPSTPMHQYLARYNEEMTKEELVKAREELFRFQIQYLHELAGTRKLILREWSHGDFFETNRYSSSTLPLLDFAEPVSVVSLRHPIDIYLSGKTYNAWRRINSDINEFCQRYYRFCRFFLDRPKTLIVRYEDFAVNPDVVLSSLCEKLDLTFNPNYRQDLGKHRLSGASGRMSTDKIEPRPRRPMSDTDKMNFLRSEFFFKACAVGGYRPDLDESPPPPPSHPLNLGLGG